MTTYRQVWSMLDPESRRLFPLAVLLALVLSGLETLGVGLVFPLLQNFGGSADQASEFLSVVGLSSDGSSTASLLIAIVVLFLIKNVLGMGITWWNYHYSLGIKARMTHAQYCLYLQAPYQWHVEMSSARVLMNYEALYKLVNNIVIPTVNALTDIAIFILLMGLLFWANPTIALISALILGIGAAAYVAVNARVARRSSEQILQYFGVIINGIHESLGAIREIRILGRESAVMDIFNRHVSAAARVQLTQSLIQALPKYYLESIVIIALSVAFGIESRSSTGPALFATIGLFLAAGVRLLPTVNRLVSAYQSIIIGQPACEIVYSDFLATRIHETKDPIAKVSEPLPKKADIELKNVVFRYRSRDVTVLKDISFRIRHGEMVGIVGASGSGKSTLVDILTGLISPTEGSVLIGGKPIQSVLRDWQNRIGFVPQSIFLVDDTIRKNIAFGIAEENIDDQRVEEVIRAVALEDVINSLPEGKNTRVGERGAQLSGGQRQRIGIARALYNDPDVLILDEATSSLDNETEHRLRQFMTSIHHKKTLVVIAHRVSSLMDADRIVFLMNGVVNATGKYEELLEQNAAFRDLVAPTSQSTNGSSELSHPKETNHF